MAFAQVLILVFIMAAHVLSFAIALNAMTDHGWCTVGFSAVGLMISFVLSVPRTLKNVSYLSIFCKWECNEGFTVQNLRIEARVLVIVAVLAALVGIAVDKPDMGNIVAVRPNPTVIQGLGPVMNIVLAYGTRECTM